MSTTTPTPTAEATPTPTAEATPPATTTATMPTTCCGRRTVLRAAGLVALSGGAVALAAIAVSVFVGLMGVVLAVSPIAGQAFGAGRLHRRVDQREFQLAARLDDRSQLQPGGRSRHVVSSHLCAL